MPQKTQDKGNGAQESTPVTRKCESCDKVLPSGHTQPPHPMCGLCTVKLDPEHFSLPRNEVKCTACRAFPKQSYNDYKRKAAFYHKYQKWISVSAIRRFYQEQHEEKEEDASVPANFDNVEMIEIELEDQEFVNEDAPLLRENTQKFSTDLTLTELDKQQQIAVFQQAIDKLQTHPPSDPASGPSRENRVNNSPVMHPSDHEAGGDDDQANSPVMHPSHHEVRGDDDQGLGGSSPGSRKGRGSYRSPSFPLTDTENDHNDSDYQPDSADSPPIRFKPSGKSASTVQKQTDQSAQKTDLQDRESVSEVRQDLTDPSASQTDPSVFAERTTGPSRSPSRTRGPPQGPSQTPGPSQSPSRTPGPSQSPSS